MTTRNREQTLAFRYLPFASAFSFLISGVWRFCFAFDHCVCFVSFSSFLDSGHPKDRLGSQGHLRPLWSFPDRLNGEQCQDHPICDSPQPFNWTQPRVRNYQQDSRPSDRQNPCGTDLCSSLMPIIPGFGLPARGIGPAFSLIIVVVALQL